VDYFKSVILNREVLSDIDGHALVENLSHDLVGNDDPQMNILVDGMDNDDLHIDTQAWGWWDGGLHRIMSDKRSVMMGMDNALYFRGAAMFGSFDDAKNDYLMTPELLGDDEVKESCEGHVPFGMVIPQWNERGENIGVGTVEVWVPILVSVTIILFWQPL